MVVLDTNIWQTIAYFMLQFAFTPCIPTGHKGFLSSCQARECSEITTHWRGTLCVAALPECEKLPPLDASTACRSWLCWWLSGCLGPSFFLTSSCVFLIAAAAQRSNQQVAPLIFLPQQGPAAGWLFSCPYTKTTDKHQQGESAFLSGVCSWHTMLLNLLIYALRTNKLKRASGIVLMRMTSPQQLSGRGLDPVPKVDLVNLESRKRVSVGQWMLKLM